SLLRSAIRVVQEYERGVIFRLGRLAPPPRGPGLFLIIPIIDRMVKVDLRTVTLEVPPQEVISRDNVTIRVNAVLYFRVVEPMDAVVKIFDHVRATSQISQTTLRSVLGQSELDELLATHPQALQLRFLQTLVEISGERNSTIVFPIPIELLGGLNNFLNGSRPAGGDGR